MKLIPEILTGAKMGEVEYCMCVKFSKKRGHSSRAPGTSTCFLQKNVIMGYSNPPPPCGHALSYHEHCKGPIT